MSNQFLYKELHEEFKNKIKKGFWGEGEKIPSENSLVKEYNVSRYTIRKTLDLLETEGYIDRRVGSGTFVNTNTSRKDFVYLKSFTEKVKSFNLTPSSKIIRIEKVKPTPLVQKYLKVDENYLVFIVERVRYADDMPICYELVYIDPALCPDIDELIDENSSLYDIYENHYNFNMVGGDFIVQAMNCPKEYAKHLNISSNDPVLQTKSVVSVRNSGPLYCVRCFYIGDKYKFFTNIPRHI